MGSRAPSRWVAVAVAMGAAVLVIRGCGQEDGAGGGDSEPDAASNDATIEHLDTALPPESAVGADGDGDGPAPEVGTCPGVPLPVDLPEGWVDYPVFDCEHRLYVPTAKQYLPSGVSWKECTDVGPDPYTCREMVIDWTSDGIYLGGAVIPEAFQEVDGTVVLQFNKIFLRTEGSKKIYDALGLVVEADGAVRQALLMKDQVRQAETMSLGLGGVAQNKAIWTAELLGESVMETVARAFLGGDSAALKPPVLHRNDDSEGVGLARAGNRYWAINGRKMIVSGWDGAEYGTVWDGPLDTGLQVWAADTLLWEATSSAVNQVWMWSQANGAEALRSFGSDTSRGAAAVGGDAVDLVWLEGEGGSAPYYAKRSIMTAKLPQSPAQLQPRRLRSWIPPLIWAGPPTVVGCGYAAFEHTAESLFEQVLIVRLSDGAAWLLRNPDDRHWSWSNPILVTCDEVWIPAGGIGNNPIRRVRLDSLGPPMPAD